MDLWETLQPLRWQYDELGSRTLEVLLNLSEEERSQSQCPVPRVDLINLLENNYLEHPTLAHFREQSRYVPRWVDWTQISRGQDVFYRYAVANMVGFALQGFIGENAAAFGPAEVLTRTGGLSPKNLIQRVMETFQWVLQVTRSVQDIQPGGQGHASTLRVRLLHASVRRKILQLASTQPNYFDTETYGVPINSFDSVLTITFFCCNPIWVQLPQFGIKLSDQEKEDFIALYRYLSYLLGTPDRYFQSAQEAQTTMQAMLSHKKPPSASSRQIAHAFIDSLADRAPFYISRGFIEAGCRIMNPTKLCNDLELGHPGLMSYATFRGFCWVVHLLSLLQQSSRRIDRHIISVSLRKALD